MRDIPNTPTQLHALCQQLDSIEGIEALSAHHRSAPEVAIWQVTLGIIEAPESWERLRALSFIIEKSFSEYSTALGLRLTTLTLTPHYQTVMVDMQPASVFNLSCQSINETQGLICADLLATYISGEPLPDTFPEFLS